MDISVAANITLARLDATMRHGFIDHRRERAIADEWIHRLRIKTPSANAGLPESQRRQPAEDRHRSMANGGFRIS